MRRFHEALARVEEVLAALSAAAFIGIMGLMLADVASRYLFSSPFAWSFDVLTRYLLLAALFFAYGYTLRHGEHLYVEVICHHIPPRPRALLLGIAYVPATAVVALAFWTSVQTARRSWTGDERLVGAIDWPIWTSKAIIVIGLGVLLLRCVERTIALLAAGAGGGGTVALPGSRDLRP